jgi:hypothetical protein
MDDFDSDDMNAQMAGGLQLLPMKAEENLDFSMFNWKYK